MQVVGNSSRKHENFNGVSDELKKELIKPLGKGDVAHFQLLNGTFDPSLKREVFGASRSIVLRDRIYDPYIKDEKGGKVGGYVEIGVPETIKDGRVEKCKKYWVEALANGIPGNGQFGLTQASISEMEIYEFLCLSNGSKTNPHRDASQPAKYELIDKQSILSQNKERDFKELKAKLARFSKENPKEAEELKRLLPETKDIQPPEMAKV